jgi:hypothetical protein
VSRLTRRPLSSQPYDRLPTIWLTSWAGATVASDLALRERHPGQGGEPMPRDYRNGPGVGGRCRQHYSLWCYSDDTRRPQMYGHAGFTLLRHYSSSAGDPSPRKCDRFGMLVTGSVAGGRGRSRGAGHGWSASPVVCCGKCCSRLDRQRIRGTRQSTRYRPNGRLPCRSGGSRAEWLTRPGIQKRVRRTLTRGEE